MAQSNWEADKMLDVYIYDYLVKRNLQASAKAFLAEGKVSSDPVAIDAPNGFLFEWWSVFWDIFIARTNDKHSEVAASYIETQQLKAREQQLQHQQQQQQLHNQQLHQQQQLQMQQLQLMQRQQPRRDLNLSSSSLLGGADALLRQPSSTANAIATRIYEERLKPPQRDATMDDASMKRPMLQTTANTSSASLQQVQSRSQQLSANSQGMDLLRPGVQQKSMLQASPSSFQQFQLLSPQQQQMILQAQAAQGNMSPSGSQMLPDVDPRRYRVLVGRNGVLGSKDNVSNDVGSPLQSTSTLARAQSQEQAELAMKVKVAQQQQHQQQQQQHQQQQQQQQSKMQNSQHAQQQQSVLQQQQQQDKMGFSSAGQTDTLSSYRTNDQIYGAVEPSPSANSTGTGKTSTKGPSGRKRKQPASSSGPANSTGTGNTAGRSPNSPSTPSTHTPGDVSMGGGVQSASMSKSMLMYTDGAGSLPSPSNQLVDMDRFGDDGSLDDNVESFLSHEEADPRESLFVSSKRSPAGHSSDVSKGFTFGEFACLRASASKVVCCHFSSDGKLLASAGHDKKAFLWNMDTLSMKHSLEEHSFLITDVRFSPNSARLATSSFDKTVRVWDADNPAYSLRTFTGHGTSVMSLDFHPTNEDLLCSCDGDSEIRYWNVNQGVCTRAFKGGMTQTRFQPRLGRLLAAAAESTVSIFDVDSETCIHSLQRHTKPVHSVCWDITGDYLASVSEDSVRVWALGANGGGECIHELNCSGNKFHSCVFHPNYPSLLVIGCYQSLELWNMAEKKSMTIPAHDGLIAALAQCPATGLVASASHDKCVKLWK